MKNERQASDRRFEQELEKALTHFDAYGINERGEIEMLARKFYKIGKGHESD